MGATMLMISPELVRVRVDRENSTGLPQEKGKITEERRELSKFKIHLFR